MEEKKEIRCCIPVPKLENDGYDWWERHEKKCTLVREKRFDTVFFGDSITHFWTKENNVNYGEGHWDEVFAEKSVLNLGYGFDRIQNVLWRMENGELENQDPKNFVINIGTNQFSITQNYDGDPPEETAQGICFLAEKLRKKFPEAKIIVMALFPRSNKMQEVIAVNQRLHQALDRRSDIILLDIFEKLLLKNAVPTQIDLSFYKDGTHLNRKGYEIWYEALEKYL